MTEQIGNHPNQLLSRGILVAIVLVHLLIAAFAFGQGSSRSQRDAAIALGEEGLALLERGEHAAALRKFDAAEELIPAPTFGVRAALCLEYLGRWVEALERYERVATMQVDPNWPQIHKQAQEEATQRAAALRIRVARLELVFRGEGQERATIKLDGRKVPADVLVSGILLDPGEHVIELIHDDKVELRRFRVKEGQRHREGFLLGSHPEDVSAPSTRQTLGWVGVGLGATGIVVGTATGFVAWQRQSELYSRCPGRVCPPGAWEENNAYNRWRNASTVAFSVGGVLVGGGALLLLTGADASAEKDDVAVVEPWIGLGSAGLRGGF